MSVEEAITVFEMLHLKSNNTCRDGPYHSALGVIFMVGTDEKIDIIGMTRKSNRLDQGSNKWLSE